jgi:hypothetical protein
MVMLKGACGLEEAVTAAVRRTGEVQGVVAAEAAAGEAVVFSGAALLPRTGDVRALCPSCCSSLRLSGKRD